MKEHTIKWSTSRRRIANGAMKPSSRPMTTNDAKDEQADHPKDSNQTKRSKVGSAHSTTAFATLALSNAEKTALRTPRPKLRPSHNDKKAETRSPLLDVNNTIISRITLTAMHKHLFCFGSPKKNFKKA